MEYFINMQIETKSIININLKEVHIIYDHLILILIIRS